MIIPIETEPETLLSMLSHSQGVRLIHLSPYAGRFSQAQGFFNAFYKYGEDIRLGILTSVLPVQSNSQILKKGEIVKISPGQGCTTEMYSSQTHLPIGFAHPTHGIWYTACPYNHIALIKKSTENNKESIETMDAINEYFKSRIIVKPSIQDLIEFIDQTNKE